MVKKIYIPERGDVIWVDFDPSIGHEQKGKRPALVLSHRSYNSFLGLAILCPITSKTKGYNFEVAINEEKIKGIVLSDQIKSFDWKNRQISFVCSVPKEVVDDVVDKVREIIF